jgi:hypothetical protein
MYLPKVLDPKARDYRVRYAIATILRDRIANEGAFKNCFEMEDGDTVIYTILRRGLKNPKLRAALQGSHLVNVHQWLAPYPELVAAYYYAPEETASVGQKPPGQRRKRR